MPLHVRSIALNVCVVCFFGLSLMGSISGLSPFTCCKRAVVGAVLSYIVTALATKAINAILLSAMLAEKIRRNKEKDSDEAN